VQCKALKLNFLPLSERLISESLISVNLVLPKAIFIMWCKKCWQFLEAAKIKVQAGSKKQKQQPAKSGS